MNGLVDHSKIVEFLKILHDHAASLSRGAERPGYVQLVGIYSGGERDNVVVHRFMIGQWQNMADTATTMAESGFNCYVEGRTVRQDLKGNERGEIEDTIFVFAFVVDNDADHDRTSVVNLEASMVVETSANNTHQWLLLDKPISGKQGAELGRRIRHGTRADGPTGNIATPFRIAGTPNFPSQSKVARGRTVVPTRVASRSSRLWSVDEIEQTFPALSCSDYEKDSDDILVNDEEMFVTTDALKHIPNDGDGLEYDEWLRVVFGLEWAARNATTKEVAKSYKDLCERWSRQSKKYRASKQRKTMRSCRPTSKPCTLATVYWMAWQYGWSQNVVRYRNLESKTADNTAARLAALVRKYGHGSEYA